MALKNQINTYADLTAYNDDQNKEYPNVSYIVATDEVKWQATEPIDQVHVVAKYNVTSTETATKLLNSTSGITYQIIDGVQQQSVQMNYTFDTLGEHVVKYKLTGTSIGDNAFRSCIGLTSITIPDSVTTIGESAFQSCTGLTSVTMGSGVTTIPPYAFRLCSGLTSITIPNGVTSIGDSAFSSCASLTSITIPNGVTSIGDSAFRTCVGLTNIGISDSVTSISQYAFDNCRGLTSVTIGNGVTSIGDSAFENTQTNNNFSLYIYATTPPTLGTRVFRYTGTDFKIYVPAASVSAYQTAWSDYASKIQAIPTT